MTHSEMCSHQISIVNFADHETVTYSLIKLIGTIVIETCQNSNGQNVRLFKNENSLPTVTQLSKNLFKFFIELEEGRNFLKIKYCNDTLNFTLDYIPSRYEHAVIPLYVISEGHDGRFQAPEDEDNSVESACRRITLCAKILQSITAEKLFENSFGRKTFKLEGDCKIFTSRLNYLEARKMNQEELWRTIGREIMTSPLGSENKKFLGFLSCTRYRGEEYTENMKAHENLIAITGGYVALGGGGLALFGTACLYTWPERFADITSRFEDTTVVDRSRFLDDSCYRGTKGACFSTTLGSVLHELYHTFDLGHTANGIMGRGFDNIHKMFIETNFEDTHPSCELSRTYRDEIHFQEKLEPKSLSERLLAVNKKKEFTVIKKLEDVGDTVLERSCAVLLCYHRWFLEIAPNQSFSLTFDNSLKVVKSTAGIRVIEIRSTDTEMVLDDWIFIGRVLKFSFQIPEDTVKNMRNQTCFLVVEDSIGNLLKEKITF